MVLEGNARYGRVGYGKASYGKHGKSRYTSKYGKIGYDSTKVW